MGAFPGPVGFAAFAGVKFGGYVLAGVALKHFEPAISAGAAKIAATRTGLGILLGPPLTIAVLFAFEKLLPQSQLSNSPLPMVALYAFLFTVRIFVWALVIYIFSRRLGLARSRFWKYAAIGAAWSCLLDLPGFGLALISPGQIPIC